CSGCEGLDDGLHERRARPHARLPTAGRGHLCPSRCERHLATMIGTLALMLMAQASTQQWPQHSMDRPRPPVVDPGPERPAAPAPKDAIVRSEVHTSELQSRSDLVCRLLLEKKKKNNQQIYNK